MKMSQASGHVTWLLPDDQCAVIGANVRALRLSRGWSQSHLGGLMGWRDGTAVCRIEGQVRTITVDELERLAAIFRLPSWRLKHRCVNCGGCPPAGFACLSCGARKETEPGDTAGIRRAGEHASEPTLSPGTAGSSLGPRPGSSSAPPVTGSRRRRPRPPARAAPTATAANPDPTLAAHRLDGRGPLLPPQLIGGSGTAPWMVMARAVAAAITAGQYEPGHPLSWRDLAPEHSVAEDTARRALSELLALGYAVHRAGRLQVAADAIPAPPA